MAQVSVNSSPILITGVTGFLGGFLAGELIKRGRKTLLLVRPKGNDSAQKRVGRLMKFLDIEPEHSPIVISGEIDKPGLGLSAEHTGVLQNVKEVLHCAADTSFAQRKKQQVEQTNLQGLQNVFNAVPNCERFYHMSSAYSAGKQEGIVKEEMLNPQAFHNPYERSKNEAEKLITNLCREKGIELTIFRPSITYGDTTTGKSLRFNALYFPVRTLLFFKDSLKKDILERSGQRAAQLGVSINENGTINLPLTFPGSGGLNLVPINFLVEAVTAIMDSGENGIFHIVNPQIETIHQLAQNIQKHYAISGLSVAEKAAQDGPLQTLINSYIDVYYPYFCDNRIFDDYQAKKILEPLGIECPELTSDVFKRCMDFAIEVDWGSKIRV